MASTLFVEQVGHLASRPANWRNCVCDFSTDPNKTHKMVLPAYEQ